MSEVVGQKQKCSRKGHVNVQAVSSMSTGRLQRMPDHHIWAANVMELSVDDWQPNEDAVVMQSQRLEPSVPPDTVE